MDGWSDLGCGEGGGGMCLKWRIFVSLEKTLKSLTHSSFWADEIENQMMWFVIILTCSAPNKKTSWFFLIINVSRGLWVAGGSNGRTT